jgi:hypothetical protein
MRAKVVSDIMVAAALIGLLVVVSVVFADLLIR